jgi:YidC/Oxa1 family membrane protein insertase
MPDSQNSGNKIGPPKEMSMEMRLLLALLLTVPILFLGPYLLGPQTSKQPEKKSVAQPSQAASSNPAAQTSAKAPPPEPSAAASAPSKAPAGSGTPQQPLPSFFIDTNLYHVVFTNHGADVQSWQLKKYRGNDGKQLDLVNSSARWVSPFSLEIPSDRALEQRLNWTYYSQTADPDGLGVVYQFSDGHVAMKKTFRFEKDSYLSRVSTELTIDGNRIAHGIVWRGGFGDLTVANPSPTEHAVYYDLSQGKLVDYGPTSASKGVIQGAGMQSFAGIADAYFAAVFLPANEDAMHETIFTDYAPTPLDSKKLPFPGIAVSDGQVNEFRLFVGPKDVDLLKRIDPKLEQLIDFGWMAIIAKPLFLIVNWTNDNIVHSFGWAIILITVVINLALFPLRISSMKSMRKMQALKPQIDAINAKYKGMSVRDPKKADQTAETMDLYKKHGVNPMGGCLPMVLQLPILIAFYRVFSVSVEMRGATWLWVTDLSQPETIPIRLLPLILIATQFLTQKMMPQPGADPAQQRMTMFMPLIFGFMFYNFPSGLVLYYLTSNLVGVGLQWFFNKTDTARLAAQSVEAPPKKKSGKK